MACDLAEAGGQASDARDDARAIGDPVFEAAALAGGALAQVSGDRAAWTAAARDRGRPPRRSSGSARSSSRRGCRRSGCSGARGGGSGAFEAALAALERGAALAAETGRENVRLQLTVELVPTLIELGRPAEATAAAEQGLERARLAGNPRMLLWARCALSSARLAAGDVSAALQHAERGGRERGAGRLPRGGPARLVPRQRADRGRQPRARRRRDARVLRRRRRCPPSCPSTGPPRPPTSPRRSSRAATPTPPRRCCGSGSRPARLAVGTSGDGHGPLRHPARPGACGRGRRRGDGATARGAPLAAARARLAEGRALAAAGRRAEALEALIAAESALDGFGSLRRRDEAARELRRLGHRVRRPAREAVDGPLAALTAREREIAGLVAAGRTNREVAEQLVLSARTIEAHLRNVYGKLGVRSRVELTRAVERAPTLGVSPPGAATEPVSEPDPLDQLSSETAARPRGAARAPPRRRPLLLAAAEDPARRGDRGGRARGGRARPPDAARPPRRRDRLRARARPPRSCGRSISTTSAATR